MEPCVPGPRRAEGGPALVGTAGKELVQVKVGKGKLQELNE